MSLLRSKASPARTPGARPETRAAAGANAQNLSNLKGKILRSKPDGTIPPDNPFHNAVGNGSCSGIAIVRDILYIACEKGTRLIRGVITSGGSLTAVQSFFVGTFGRLRTVEPTPGGNLRPATSNGGDKDSPPNNSNNRIFKVILGT